MRPAQASPVCGPIFINYNDYSPGHASILSV